MDIGKLIYKVEVDQSGFIGGLTSAIGSITKTVAVGVASVSTAAATAISALGVASVKAFGEVEQQLGGTEAVFGQFASTVQQQAEQAYKSMGMAANEYMATANKMGSLLQGSGLTQQRSLELTSAAMQRAADVASVMGVDTKMAMESIAGAAKGNFSMMDNLGVSMNATTLEAYALSKGITTAYSAMSNTQKTELAMQMFMERTAQYAGNFAKESEQSIAGSIGMLKSSIANFVADMSNSEADIASSAGRIAENAAIVIKNVVPALTTYAKNLPKVIAGFIRSAPDVISEIKAGAAEIAGAFIGSFQEQFGSGGGIAGLIGSLRDFGANIVLNIGNAAMAQLPAILDLGANLIYSLYNGTIQALPTLMDGILNILVNVSQIITNFMPTALELGSNLLSSLVVGIIQQLPKIIEAATAILNNFIQMIVANLPAIIALGADLLYSLLTYLPSFIGDMGNAATDIVGTLVNNLVANAPSLVEAGGYLMKSLFKGVYDVFLNLGQRIGNVIVDWVDGIVAVFKDVGAIMSGDFSSPNSRAFQNRQQARWADLEAGASAGTQKALASLSRTTIQTGNYTGFIGGQSSTSKAPGLWELTHNGQKYSDYTKAVTAPTITSPSFTAPKNTAPDLKSFTSTIASDAAKTATKAAAKSAADTMKAHKIATGSEIKPVGTGYGVSTKAQESSLSMIEKLLEKVVKNTGGSIHSVVRLDGKYMGSETYKFNDELSASTGIS